MRSGKLYVCPRCGKENLSVHRKTYEKIIIVFCDNCHLNASFEPSKEADYDPTKSWEVFTAGYKMVRVRRCQAEI